MHFLTAHDSRPQTQCAAKYPARTQCPIAGISCGRLLLLALCACLTASAALGGGTGPQPVTRSPNHVCLSVDGLKAFVTNQTSNSVSVLDLVARKVVAEIPVGPFPSYAVPSPDGQKLYVSCTFGAQVDVIDLPGGTVIGSVPVGDEPHGLALSPDGQTLYVANSLSGTLSIIDLPSAQSKYTIPVGREPRFVTPIPGGSRLLVGSSLSRSIAVVDTATGHVLETRDLDRGNLARQVACTSDGRWGFVAHVISQDKFPPMQMERGMIHANGFSILDLEKPGHRVTLLLDHLLLGAANPWGLAVSSDDRHLFVSLAGVHEIAIVDLAKVVSLVTQLRPEEIEPLAQNLEIMQRQDILRRVASGGLGPRGIALDEKRGALLVANYFSDSIAILDAHSGAVRAVIPLGPHQEMTSWRRGEMLFNDARLCFQQWFSCASGNTIWNWLPKPI
ncbi:MAG: hypothetical protein ACC645_26165 [Pirellulales bacterium]